MRTWIVVAATVMLAVMIFAGPTRSADDDRIRSVMDLTPVTKRMDELKLEVIKLEEQNAALKKDLQKAVEDGNKTLELIAAGLAVMREPKRWEYHFARTRSEKLANELGVQGWEMVEVFEDKWFVFRRPLPPKADEPDGKKP